MAGEARSGRAWERHTSRSASVCRQYKESAGTVLALERHTDVQCKALQELMHVRSI